VPDPAEASRFLAALLERGVDRILSEHRAAWAARWAAGEVAIEGDPEIELGARFSIFHLLASASGGDEAPVGARGLTGPAYAGHVFWDTDVFVLPALAATNPPAARAVLEYRLRRLDAARRIAAVHDSSGVRFPWESARVGDDVTPRFYTDSEGKLVPIRTGDAEEHIDADVAWAAQHYAAWTGDDAFVTGVGRPLLTETARYWASRVRLDVAGRGHIYGVIGPDEYHEIVDDNAYTNVMARWNLRAGATLVERDRGGGWRLAEHWRRLADAIEDGFDPTTGRYEQFAGFFALEPLLISEFGEPPVAADLLLGRERVMRSQVIKQPDVLMLHHLVPDEVVPDSLEANLDFYLPRTAHGSSLSPAICASLLARAGRVDEARDLLEIACRLDLDDLTGMTAGGVHLATMGGVWQALVFGFVGARPQREVLDLDPRLPSRWERLSVRLCFRGARLKLTVGSDWVEVATDAPVRVRFPGGDSHRVVPEASTFELRGGRWQRRPI
jgi:trehalose/maltose hydrolase-like predicted phosphorylase